MENEKVKVVRHCERMQCVDTINECHFEHKPLKVLVTTSNLDEDTGRMISKTELRTVDRKEEMKNYRVQDFCLENLLAIGAPLTPVQLEGSRDASMSAIEGVLDYLVNKETSDINN